MIKEDRDMKLQNPKLPDEDQWTDNIADYAAGMLRALSADVESTIRLIEEEYPLCAKKSRDLLILATWKGLKDICERSDNLYILASMTDINEDDLNDVIKETRSYVNDLWIRLGKISDEAGVAKPSRFRRVV